MFFQPSHWASEAMPDKKKAETRMKILLSCWRILSEKYVFQNHTADRKQSVHFTDAMAIHWWTQPTKESCSKKLRQKISSSLICLSSGLPSPADIEGNDCSVSPKGTCSSCGTNDYILPRPQHNLLVYFLPGIEDMHPWPAPGRWRRCRTPRPSST